MAAHAEQLFWPDDFEEYGESERCFPNERIVQFRHRVGDYDVTRVILERTSTRAVTPSSEA